MRLNQASDFALRLVMQCAMQPDLTQRIEQVVQQQGFSRGHVMKLVNQLSRAGILKTMRGRGGGFKLGRAAKDISVGDVVRAVESDFAWWSACVRTTAGQSVALSYPHVV